MSPWPKGKAMPIAIRKKIAASLLGPKNPMFGKTHTAEAKRKSGEKKIGQALSTATRQKIARALSGKPSGFTGKTHSVETRGNMSYYFRTHHPMKGKKHSEQSKQLMRQNRKGKGGRKGVRLTKAQKEKISLAMSGKKNPNFGKHRSQQTREKISAALTNYRNGIKDGLINAFRERGFFTVWQNTRGGKSKRVLSIKKTRKITPAAVRDAVLDLPSPERPLIQLVFGFFEEPKSISEAAKALRITEDKAKAIFERALSMLKKSIDNLP